MSVDIDELYRRHSEGARAFYLPSAGEGYLSITRGAPTWLRADHHRDGDFFGSVLLQLTERSLITAVNWPREKQLEFLYFLTAVAAGRPCDFSSSDGLVRLTSRRRMSQPSSSGDAEIDVVLKGVRPRESEELAGHLLVDAVVSNGAAWRLAEFLPGISIYDLDLP